MMVVGSHDCELVMVAVAGMLVTAGWVLVVDSVLDVVEA